MRRRAKAASRSVSASLVHSSSASASILFVCIGAFDRDGRDTGRSLLPAIRWKSIMGDVPRYVFVPARSRLDEPIAVVRKDGLIENDNDCYQAICTNDEAFHRANDAAPCLRDAPATNTRCHRGTSAANDAAVSRRDLLAMQRMVHDIRHDARRAAARCTLPEVARSVTERRWTNHDERGREWGHEYQMAEELAQSLPAGLPALSSDMAARYRQWAAGQDADDRRRDHRHLSTSNETDGCGRPCHPWPTGVDVVVGSPGAPAGTPRQSRATMHPSNASTAKVVSPGSTVPPFDSRGTMDECIPPSLFSTHQMDCEGIVPPPFGSPVLKCQECHNPCVSRPTVDGRKEMEISCLDEIEMDCCLDKEEGGYK